MLKYIAEIITGGQRNTIDNITSFDALNYSSFVGVAQV